MKQLKERAMLQVIRGLAGHKVRPGDDPFGYILAAAWV